MRGAGANLLGQVLVWKRSRVSELAFGRCSPETQSRALGKALSSRAASVASGLRGPAASVRVRGLRHSDFGKWLRHAKAPFTCLCSGMAAPSSEPLRRRRVVSVRVEQRA